MPDPVRIAILGNSFASNAQIPALRWAGGNEVIGVAGRDGAKAQATADTFGLAHATTDYRSLLDLAPDLVFVSTPVHLHHEMTLAALEAGAAVLCEKPFALDEAQALDMVAAAEGRPAYLDHQLRWSPHLRVLREMVADGFIGEPWHLRFDMLLDPARFRVRPWSWWFDRERGGGILGAIGSHMLDAVRWLFGEIDTVHAELSTFLPERPDADGRVHPVTADEHAHLSLGFESGLAAELTTSIAVPSEETFWLQVTGSEGTLRCVGGDALFGAQAGEELVPVEVEPGLPSAASYGIRHGGMFGRCLPLYLRDLVAAVRDGRSDLEHAATFTDGLAIQRVLDAARDSSAG